MAMTMAAERRLIPDELVERIEFLVFQPVDRDVRPLLSILAPRRVGVGVGVRIAAGRSDDTRLAALGDIDRDLGAAAILDRHRLAGLGRSGAFGRRRGRRSSALGVDRGRPGCQRDRRPRKKAVPSTSRRKSRVVAKAGILLETRLIRTP
jgi:hypothetical protein